jgi:hypothetical protein
MTTLLRKWERRRDLLVLPENVFDFPVRMWLVRGHLISCTATAINCGTVGRNHEITGLRDTGTRPTEGSEVRPVAGQQRIVWVVSWSALHHA